VIGELRAKGGNQEKGSFLKLLMPHDENFDDLRHGHSQK